MNVTDRIVIGEGIAAHITLENLTLNALGGSAIDLGARSTLDLNLKGTNTLTPVAGSVGIRVPAGTALNISSEDGYQGKLVVKAAGYDIAAIGTDINELAGTINITSGWIEAVGDPGIGSYKGGETLSITGGYVKAPDTGFGIYCDFSSSRIEGAFVDATSHVNNIANSLIRHNTTYSVYGEYTLPFDYTIAEGKILSINPTNKNVFSHLTVPAGVTLTNNGTINMNNESDPSLTGTLTMDGTYAGAGQVIGTGTVDGDNAEQIVRDGVLVGEWLVAPNTLIAGTHYTFEYGQFTLLSLPEGVTEITIRNKDPQTPVSQYIVVATDAVLNLNNVNIEDRNEPLTIKEGKKVTLNLIGNNCLKGKEVTTSGIKCNGIYIETGASLTVIGTGKLQVSGNDANADMKFCSASNGGHGIVNKGTLTLDAANIEIKGGNAILYGDSTMPSENYSVSRGTGIYSDDGIGTTLNIRSGTVTVTGGNGSGPDGSFIFNGNGIEEQRVINITGGNVTVTGGDASKTSLSRGKEGKGIECTAHVSEINASKPELTIENAVVTVKKGVYGDGIETDVPAIYYNERGSIFKIKDSFLRAATMSVGGNSYSFEDSVAENSIVLIGEKSRVYGEVRLTEDLTVEKGEILTIPSKATLTVPAGMTLTNKGKIIIEAGGKLVIEPALAGGTGGIPGGEGSGTVTNDGTIKNYGDVDNKGTITNNDTFHNYGEMPENGGSFTGDKAEKSLLTLTITDEAGKSVTEAKQGDRVTLTAEVRGEQGQTVSIATSQGTASDVNTVTFYQGDSKTGNILAENVPVTSDGTAFTEISLTGGSWTNSETPYTITAVYHGDKSLLDSEDTAKLLVTATGGSGSGEGSGGSTGGGNEGGTGGSTGGSGSEGGTGGSTGGSGSEGGTGGSTGGSGSEGETGGSTGGSGSEGGTGGSTGGGNGEESSIKLTDQRLKTTAGNNAVRLTWSRVNGADGYLIYGALAGSSMKQLADVKDGNTGSYTKTGLKTGRYYRFSVRAYKLVDKKRVTVGKSWQVYAVTKGGRYGNPAKVMCQSAVTVAEGSAAALKPQQTSRRTVKLYTAKFRYFSSDQSVAAVDRNGKVKGLKKGTCDIYVYAQNGQYAKVKVTVKK